MIWVKLDEILNGNGDMSVYRLSQLTGLSEITLTKFLKRKGKGVHYNTLDRICDALKCTPGDLLEHITVTDSKEKGRQK